MNIVRQHITDRYAIYNGDCVDVVRSLPASSVDFAVFSPPFASLYTYSASDRDMGNTKNDTDFATHFGFLIDELARAMKPGRLIAIHCMQLPTSKARDGFIGLRDFRGAIIAAFVERGLVYHSEVCIWKDPVMQMQRTKTLGLLHKTIRSDSAMSRQGLADYLVVMRTPGKNAEPIAHGSETAIMSGTKILPAFPVERWQRYASPVWATAEGVDDEGFVMYGNPNASNGDKRGIDQGDTLQHRSVRENDDERHLCPLQLPVIRRAIRLWTNTNDIVLSPFMGIGSEGVVAIEEGRRFCGAELKSVYYDQARANIEAVASHGQASLFAEASP